MSALPTGPPHALAVEHVTRHGCPHVRATCACGWASAHWYAGVALVGREYWAHVRNAEAGR